MKMEESFDNPLPNPPPSKGEGIRENACFSSKGEGMKRSVSRRKRGPLGHAKRLRRTLTEMEKILWYHLRAKRFSGYKFRRQYPVGQYIADFASIQCHLIIELDGSQHAWRSDDDKRRDKFLRGEGFRVLRFWNNEVHENLEGVLQTIHKALLPSPLPLKGEGARVASGRGLI